MQPQPTRWPAQTMTVSSDTSFTQKFLPRSFERGFRDQGRYGSELLAQASLLFGDGFQTISHRSSRHNAKDGRKNTAEMLHIRPRSFGCNIASLALAMAWVYEKLRNTDATPRGAHGVLGVGRGKPWANHVTTKSSEVAWHQQRAPEGTIRQKPRVHHLSFLRTCWVKFRR